MGSATAQTSRNWANLHHHVICGQKQSGNNLLSNSTGRHPHEQSWHRSDGATHNQVSEVPPAMRHQRPNERRSTWTHWNGTRRLWLRKCQQKPYMSRAYGFWHSTSSTNGLYQGRINKIGIIEIYQTHKSSTPTPTRCRPTQEEEN